MASEKKVLIVDDEEYIGKMMKKILENAGGYLVEIETNGSKVISTASVFEPDLILLDIVMPGMEGPDVNDQLLKNSRLKNVPVVFMTGILTDDEVDSRDGTMFDRPCIAKPVSKEKLLNCVREQLG
jgi:two-component system, OmpR family, response regulator